MPREIVIPITKTISIFSANENILNIFRKQDEEKYPWIIWKHSLETTYDVRDLSKYIQTSNYVSKEKFILHLKENFPEDFEWMIFHPDGFRNNDR